MRQRRRLFGLLLGLATAGLAGGCKRAPSGDAPNAASSASSGALADLPPLTLKDDTPNLLLTWADTQGDFHVVEHIADVPEASRGAVRVVISDKTDGTGDAVYVADLRTKGSDGAYPVKTMARSAWEDIGASKRKTRLEALAPKEAPSGEPSAAPSASATATGNVTATIYGASWCGPCHQAEALLKSLGVKVTKKDIEASPEAANEMEEKLRRVHRQGGSIPVIDVMGQIFVGFSAGALRAAVDQAAHGTTTL